MLGKTTSRLLRRHERCKPFSESTDCWVGHQAVRTEPPSIKTRLQMKLPVYILIVFSLGSLVFAQAPRTETMVEIKTVAQCRSYREAWNTSVDYDTEHS